MMSNTPGSVHFHTTARALYRRYLLAALVLVCGMSVTATATRAGAVTPGFNFAQTIPVIGSNGGFNSISCSSSLNCVAVGGSNASLPLVAMETGGVWSTATTLDVIDPTLTSIRANFQSVSCPTATTCVAVGVAGGSSTNGTVRYPLVGIWSGGIWTLRVLTSDPAGGYFDAVSCVDNNHCTAVGSDLSSDYVAQSMSRRDWGAVVVVTATDVNDNLNAVSCTDSVNCVAVGEGVNGTQAEGAQWREVNGVWQAVTLIPGTPPLSSVSCPSTTTCYAVGFTTVAVSNHGTWNAPSAQPTLGRGHVLTAISCVDAAHCTAVGYTATSTEPLSVNFDNGTWSAGISSTTPGGKGSFTSVQCFSANECVAAGSQTTPYLPIIASTGTDVPNAPTGLTVAPGNGQLTAHWTLVPPSENGGDTVDSYVASDTTGQSCTTTSNSCVLTGVPNNELETVTIVAHNAVGNSQPTSTTGALFATPSTSFGASTVFPVELATPRTPIFIAHAPTGTVVTAQAGTSTATCVADAAGECIAALGTLPSGQYVINAHYTDAGSTHHASPVVLSVANVTRKSVTVKGVSSTVISVTNGVPNSVMVVVHGGDNVTATTTLSNLGAGNIAMKGTGVFAVSDAGVSLTVG